MAKLPPLKTEIELALQYLRRKSHHNRFERAANRLEQMSKDILEPKPKPKVKLSRNTRIVGASGRTFKY